MKKQPFRCECGVQTYEPFYIGSVWMCACCAEKSRPSIVEARARQWFRQSSDHQFVAKVMKMTPEHD